MKKSARLGMGLSALMGDAHAPASAKASAPRTVPIEVLEPSPFQARSTPDPAALAELAASIKANTPPPQNQPHAYHCRAHAFLGAGVCPAA